VDGYYVVTGQVWWATAASYTSRSTFIRQDGTTTIALLQESNGAGSSVENASQVTTGVRWFNAGEYVELVASGVPTNNCRTGADDVWLTIMRVDNNTGVSGASNLFSGAKISHTTNQSITSTAAVVDMANEVFDTDNYHVSGANDSRLTVPVSGYYFVTAQSTSNVVDNYTFNSIEIRKNGTTVIGELQQTRDVTATTILRQQAVSGVHWLDAGDYVEMLLSWTPTQAAANGADDTYLSIYLVGRPSGGTGAQAIGDLTDVNLATTAPRLGDRMAYNGSEWVPIGSSYAILAGKVESFTHNANKVTVWTEVEDTDAYFGGGTVADEQWVFPFTGRYRVSYKIVLASAGASSFLWQVVARKDRGATTTFNSDYPKLRTDGQYTTSTSAIRRVIESSAIIDATAADEMDILMFHFGITRDTTAEGYVYIEYMGPTPP
jgi:hypothetical protein